MHAQNNNQGEVKRKLIMMVDAEHDSLMSPVRAKP
jgi:hypothetical protein